MFMLWLITPGQQLLILALRGGTSECGRIGREGFLAWHCGFGDAIFRQAIKRSHAVFPANFLSFFVRSSTVADADFVNPQLSARNLYRDLRLKSETIFLDWNRLNDFSAKGFVTGLHIGEVDIGEALESKVRNPLPTECQ